MIKQLKKTWVRILASLLLGGIAQEILFITSGDPARTRDPKEGIGVTIMIAVLVFIILNLIVRNASQSRIDKLKG